MDLSEGDLANKGSREQNRPLSRTTWNDRKARRELAASPAASLRIATRITGNGNGRSWFEPMNRGHDYQRDRWRPSKRTPNSGTMIAVGIAAALLATGISAGGWIADQFDAIVYPQGYGFPPSGTVSVPANIDMKRVVAKLTVQGGADNTVVQMVSATTGQNALSVYVRAHERVTVPAPVGRFHMRLIHGREWNDSRTLFGKGTLHDEVEGVMRFSRKIGHILDLQLGKSSNLVVRRIADKPRPLA